MCVRMCTCVYTYVSQAEVSSAVFAWKSSRLKALLIHCELSWFFLLKSVSFFPRLSTLPGVFCCQLLQYGLSTQHSKARPTELSPLLCLGPGVPISPSSPGFYGQLLLMFALSAVFLVYLAEQERLP